MSVFKRKQFIVHPQLQFGLLIYTLGIAVLTGFLSASWISATYTLSGFEGSWTSLTWMLLTNVILLGCWLFMGLYFTNRIFGPLYRLHSEIRAWREGTVRKPIRLRQGDFFQELIADFNSLMQEQQHLEADKNSGIQGP